MPLYEYQCDRCGRFEVIAKFSDKHLKVCKKCGGPVQRLPSAPAIQFKGTGWYVTDYAKKSGGEGSKDEGAKDEGSKGKEGKESKETAASSASGSSDASSGKSDASSSKSDAGKSEAPGKAAKTGSKKS